MTIATAATTIMSTCLVTKGTATAISTTVTLQQLQFQAHASCVCPGLGSRFVMYTAVMLLSSDWHMYAGSADHGSGCTC